MPLFASFIASASNSSTSSVIPFNNFTASSLSFLPCLSKAKYRLYRNLKLLAVGRLRALAGEASKSSPFNLFKRLVAKFILFRSIASLAICLITSSGILS